MIGWKGWLPAALGLALIGPVWAQPEIVTPDLWGSRPQPLPLSARHIPRNITIHHSGVAWKDSDDAWSKIRNLQSWGQREKGWPDLPYHYLIAPDGTIFAGRSLLYRPESNTSYALAGVVNVQLWGNFEEQQPAPLQLRSLARLVRWLCREQRIPAAMIRGHGEAAEGQTVCPGKHLKAFLDSPEFRAVVRDELTEELVLPEFLDEGL